MVLTLRTKVHQQNPFGIFLLFAGASQTAQLDYIYVGILADFLVVNIC